MMGEQKPLPKVTDGTGEFTHGTANVFVEAGTGLRLGIQVNEDGSYRTSALTIGWGMRRLDVYGGRAEMERLHRLLGAHLEQLYGYLLERDGLAADVPAEVKRQAMATPVVHFSLGGTPPVVHCDAEEHEDDTASPVLSIVTCATCREWANKHVVVRALPGGGWEAFVRVLLQPTGGPSDPVGTIAEAFAARRASPAEDGDSEGIAFLLPGERLTSAELAQLQRESAARETAASEERA